MGRPTGKRILVLRDNNFSTHIFHWQAVTSFLSFFYWEACQKIWEEKLSKELFTHGGCARAFIMNEPRSGPPLACARSASSLVLSFSHILWPQPTDCGWVSHKCERTGACACWASRHRTKNKEKGNRCPPSNRRKHSFSFLLSLVWLTHHMVILIFCVMGARLREKRKKKMTVHRFSFSLSWLPRLRYAHTECTSWWSWAKKVRETRNWWT